MDPAYVGADVAREMAETYYKENAFFTTSNAATLHLLRTDTFNLGVNPCAYIQRLTLILDYEDLYKEDADDFCEQLQEDYNNLHPLLESTEHLTELSFLFKTHCTRQ